MYRTAPKRRQRTEIGYATTRDTTTRSVALREVVQGLPPDPGVRPGGYENGHRLISFEMSKFEGDQHDDRTRQSAPARPRRGRPRRGESDLLRAVVITFADALMSADADALCNAEHG